MNRYLFAARNFLDKCKKSGCDWTSLRFYWRTYVLSRLEAVEPDVYIVSYPKCGRTWLRVILLKYLELQGFTLPQFQDKSILSIPEDRVIKFDHDQGNWVPAPLRIDQLSFNSTKYAQKHVVFLVRDPRDILVSSWYHMRYRDRVYKRDLSSFIRDYVVGVNKVIAFMNMWLDNMDIPAGFCLLTYEDLHSDPLGSIKELFKFLGIPYDAKVISTAVEESSFEKMKRMESNGSLEEPWMKPGSKNSQHSMKIRRGKVGGFREELSEEDIEFLARIIRKNLSQKLPYH